MKEPTDPLLHAPDELRAYSVYAEEPRATACDCNAVGNLKLAVTLNDDDVATLQNLGLLNGGHLMLNTVDNAVTGGQRLMPGARLNVEERKTHGV